MAKEAKVKRIKKASVKVEKSEVIAVSDYTETLEQIKYTIHESQVRAITAANKELVLLYWKIGKTICQKQEQDGWGAGVIERLGNDIQKSFPGIEGFSRPNMFRMRAFYKAYSKSLPAGRQFHDIPPEPVLTIPWRHNVVLIEKVKDFSERMFYAQKTIENGWSRSSLEMWIENDLYNRQGKAITNFKATLPEPESDLAHQTMKDPYLFDFITISEAAKEKEIESKMMDHMQKVIVELGQGFAFVGRQYPIKAGKKELCIDLLFYHLKLRCYVVVELKAREFDGRDAGQMSVYLSAVDDTLRHEDDQPTIGMILCKKKDNVVVEYALRNFNRPIGVAGYETTITEALPKEFKGSLPTIEELETEMRVEDI